MNRENVHRIHFVLINEKSDIDKYSKFLLYGLKLKLQKDVYFYECKDDCLIGAQDRPNSWFTDIMQKKGDHSVILVKHQFDEVKLSDVFDNRMHAFHSIYKHFITSINLNTCHNFGDETFYTFISYYMIPSIWNDFTDLRWGNLSCQRFLDMEYYPDNVIIED